MIQALEERAFQESVMPKFLFTLGAALAFAMMVAVLA